MSDQLRVAFQASQVVKKKKRHLDVKAPRSAAKKRRRMDEDSSDEQEQLRGDANAFNDTVVEFDDDDQEMEVDDEIDE